MRLGCHGVTQKDDCIQLALCQPCADLQIPTQWTAEHALYRQTCFGPQASACSAGGTELALTQQVCKLQRKCHHGAFVPVVGNESKAQAHGRILERHKERTL
jgi:hypothetical protein